MISLWTSTADNAAKFRRIFRLNRYQIQTPGPKDSEDILSVMKPVKEAPDRISLYGISIHLTEAIIPYIQSMRGFSPSLIMAGQDPMHFDYDSVYAWLSQLDENHRQIARPEFIKSHHGLLCFEATSLSDRVSLSLQKRLGRPAFVVNKLPFSNKLSLEYRYSPGLHDFGRREDGKTGLHIDPDLTARLPEAQISSSTILVLNHQGIDAVRASSGTDYIHSLQRFLVGLDSDKKTVLTVVWQSPSSPKFDEQKADFAAFITSVVPDLETKWVMTLNPRTIPPASRVFTLSAASGLALAQSTKRIIYTLNECVLDGVGATRLISDAENYRVISHKLTVDQIKAQNRILADLTQKYAFRTPLTSRGKFKSVIQEVVLNGIPKL